MWAAPSGFRDDCGPCESGDTASPIPGSRHAQAEANAAQEGLEHELVRSSKNNTGFQNVNRTGAKFQAKMAVEGKLRVLPTCNTAVEAATMLAIAKRDACDML